MADALSIGSTLSVASAWTTKFFANENSGQRRSRTTSLSLSSIFSNLCSRETVMVASGCHPSCDGDRNHHYMKNEHALDRQIVTFVKRLSFGHESQSERDRPHSPDEHQTDNDQLPQRRQITGQPTRKSHGPKC